VVRTLEDSAIGSDPVDFDFGIERAEFAVAGDQFRIALFGERGSKRIGERDFVARFVIGRLKDHGPVYVDALETDLREFSKLAARIFRGISSRKAIPDLTEVDAADPKRTSYFRGCQEQ